MVAPLQRVGGWQGWYRKNSIEWWKPEFFQAVGFIMQACDMVWSHDRHTMNASGFCVERLRRGINALCES